MDFSPASVAALVEAVRVRCDDETFAILATPQAQLFQPVVADETLPGASAFKPRSTATAVVYSARALYRMSNFQCHVVADSGFATIVSGLIAQEIQRLLDLFDRRYPPTPSLYEPQAY